MNAEENVIQGSSQRAGRRSKFLPKIFIFLLLNHLLGTFKIYRKEIFENKSILVLKI
jgi:hypothetical protein